MENEIYKEKAMIPNTQIETMFLRICTDDQMQKYQNLVDGKHISLATAYASNLVSRIFYKLVEEFESNGGNIETLNKTTKVRVGRPTKE